ncbi:fatty acid synthase-like [Anneissia japonica]|uniref:fatty acid synthase-like n=1 Tax=Anneissia japonica TaxID=1529436 RepID=UPI0014256C0D|nr:fatty acid synthase-like [Anneissia japonica]
MESSPDDIVIGGISGRLPEANNLDEFWQHLINGEDMVTEDDRRWLPGLYGLPKRNGKVKNLSHFDAVFFGVHAKQAHTMDPQLRLMLEITYEAIIDAGIDPATLRGSNTGVFVGSSGSEASEGFGADPETLQGYAMTGCNRAMLANRVSFFFDFKGPSYALDTACSSGLLCLENAVQAIRNGQCDAAIVGGLNVLLKPQNALQFLRLGMLSPHGACKSFDVEGNGYCRSEGFVAVMLTKQSVAKRSYATVVHSGTNTDGFKDQGITFPSGLMQKQLLEKIYTEAKVDPKDVTYVEAHGTGTKVGDPQEVNTIAEVFCSGRAEGDSLLIGSVKSNMGHSEASSGLAALAKVVLSFENNLIPPNLHFRNPNPDIPGLLDGRLKVVTEPTAFTGGYVGLNSFGFGGANVHVILKPNVRKNVSNVLTVPRLVTCAGRTEQSILAQTDAIQSHKNNSEFLNLITEVSKQSPAGLPVRGYAVVQDSDLYVDTKSDVSTNQQQLWYVFSGMGSQWAGMGRDLMSVDIFRSSIQQCHNWLSKVDPSIDLCDLINAGDSEKLKDTVVSFVGIAAIQIALVDCLNAIGLTPDGIVGHSVGELGCGYADGSLKAEEAIKAAYWRGRCVKDAKLPPGSMAAVGLTWQEAKERCPKGVVPACHNSEDTVTISGERDAVKKFVEELQAEKVFAREVQSSGVAFHSHFMKDIAPALKKALDKVITSPQRRSSRWISSSIPESNWDSALAQYSSADYHVNNLLSPVLFQEALAQVPSDAVVVEIAPHCLLQAILKRSLHRDCKIIGLTSRKETDNLTFFLKGIGKIHLSGIPVDANQLYEPVTYPVSRGTPALAPLVHWDHSQEWDVPSVETFGSGGGTSATVSKFNIDISPESPDHYLTGHCIDGRVLFPATGYLCLAWRALARYNNTLPEQTPIVFEDVHIHRATILTKKGSVMLEVRLAPASNTFEVAEGDQLTVSGKIYIPEVEQSTVDGCANDAENMRLLKTKDVYKELRLRGYDYGPTFQGIASANNDGSTGNLRWTGNWVSFLDTMLQMSVLGLPGRSLRLPTRIQSISINPTVQAEVVENETELAVYLDKKTGVCKSGGVEMRGLHATVTSRRQQQQAPPTLEDVTFVPYYESKLMKNNESVLDYQSFCHKYVGYVLQTLSDKFQTSSDGFPYKSMMNRVVEDKVSSFSQEDVKLYIDAPECGFVRIVTDILELPVSGDFEKQVYRVIDKHAEILSQDKMLKGLLKGKHLKNCLDVVLENCNVRNLKVVEVGARKGRLFSRVVPLLSSHPAVEVDITVTDPELKNFELLHSALESVEASEVEWNTLDQAPTSLNKTHLVVVDGLARTAPDIPTALANIREIIHDDGFLLLHEVTVNFHAGFSFDGFIDGLIPKDKIPRELGIYLNGAQWMTVIKEAGFEVVSRKSDGMLCTMYLCRKITHSTPKTLQMVKIADSNFEWVEELKRKISEGEENNSTERVWLVAEQVSNAGVVGMVNCLRQEPGGQRVRCIFNGDLDGSDNFDLSPSNKMMSDVLKRDLVMNVYRNGQIGSFRHNALSKASVRVLARHGRFLEIGKYDLSNNTPLGMAVFLRNVAFHGILLDALFEDGNDEWQMVADLVTAGIKSGAVTPLRTTVFEKSDVEGAFRYMAQGKHIGKVLVKVRDSVEPSFSMNALSYTYCHPNKVYIITGGLGGFGLELSHWLIHKGARNLVLTSRSGIKTGYQALCVKGWREKGVNVVVSNRDVSKQEEAELLIKESSQIGPIAGVFHLAMVLRDGMFENQTPADFEAVCAPKVTGTANLDTATRALCSEELDWFVVFSSVSCGRGNAGQANYGYANSTMERICETRRHNGLHGLAIQWGAIGDVGVVLEQMGDNETVIGGTHPQRILSCLDTLDYFLTTNHAVVSSFVRAETKSHSKLDKSSSLDLVAVVANILGVREPSSVKPDTTLADLGLDSLMGVEVKQTLERDFELVIAMKDVRLLTFNKLKELSTNSSDMSPSVPSPAGRSSPTLPILPDGIGIALVPHSDQRTLVKLNSVENDQNPVFLIHPMEGSVNIFKDLALCFSSPCYGLQCSANVPVESIQNMAADYIQNIQNLQPVGPWTVIGYSYGCCIATEISLQLQAQNTYLTNNSLVLLDGSPEFVKVHFGKFAQKLSLEKNEDGVDVGLECGTEIACICSIVEKFIEADFTQLISELIACADLDAKVNYAVNLILQQHPSLKSDDLQFAMESYIKRMKASQIYEPRERFHGSIHLLRPSDGFSGKDTDDNLTTDYDLSKVCSGDVKVSYHSGDHESFIQGEEAQHIAKHINKVIF